LELFHLEDPIERRRRRRRRRRSARASRIFTSMLRLVTQRGIFRKCRIRKGNRSDDKEVRGFAEESGALPRTRSGRAIARIAFIARSRSRCKMMPSRELLSGACISLAFPREFIRRLSYLDIELAPRPQVGVMLEGTHEDHGGLGEIDVS